MRYRLLVRVALLLSIMVGAFGNEVNAQNENVTIVDAHKANIQDTDKINEKPVRWDTIVDRENVNYNFLSKPIFTPYNVKLLNPIEPVAQSKDKNTNNYLRFGIGNYLNIDGEAYLYQPVSKSTGVGLDFKHFSSAGGIKDYAPNGFSNNYVNLYLKSILPKVAIRFDVNYDHDMFHYYGFKPSDYVADLGEWVMDNELLRDSIKKTFHTFGGRLNLTNTPLQGRNGFGYTAEIGYKYMFDRFGTAEGKADLFADFNRNVRWFKGSQNIGAMLELDIFHNSVGPIYNEFGMSYDSNPVSKISSYTRIAPYFKIEYEMLRLNIGFDLALSTAEKTRFYAHPQIELGFVPIQKQLYVYLGARGNTKRNGLQNLLSVNKFLNVPSLEYRFSNTMIDGYVGIKVNFAKYFEVNVEGGYSITKDVALFVNSPNAVFHNMFTTLYDDQNVAYGKAYLKFNMNEQYKAEVGASYQYHILKNEMYSWQNPNLNIYAKADVKVYRGLRANALIYVCGSTYAKGYTDYDDNTFENKYLPVYCDINLGLTYKLNKWLSFFADLNNILGTKYEYWNNYRSQSFNFMLGAGFSF